MQPARGFRIPDGLLHGNREGNHVVANFGFDFVDARDIYASRSRNFAAASRGTTPASARVSLAASSTSSHFLKRFSLQTRPISGRV